MKNNQVTKFLILFVFVFLCSCDLFKSMCEAEKPPKQSTTLQQIVNDTNAGETIDLEKYSNEYDITDYNAEISKNLTIKNGSFQNTTLKIKAEVKLEKVQELSVETSANLTIRDSKLNNLLLGTNAESRSTNSGNTNFDLKVIVKNCEIAEKIKINSKAKLNIAGEKTKIAKIVVAVAAEVCKILCTTEVDTKKIENVITDENGEKPEEIKITQAYKITYHSNCGELENIEDFFSPDDGTISLPTDIFKRNDYIFAGWCRNNNDEETITTWDVSGETNDINVYAKWESKFYSYTSKIGNLIFEWGGGFSVLLLTDEQLEVCNDAKDFKQATAEKPEYQIAAFGDMIVDTTKEGNFAVYGRNGSKYDGVAVTIKDNTFTLFIDMTKLTKTQLKGLWKGTEAGNEPIITEDDTVNLTGYKPYVIALTTQDKDENIFQFRAETWNADLMKMTAGATFPTDLQQSPPTTGNTNSVTVTDNNNNTETINFSELSTKLSTLSAGTYTLKVSGGITNTTITEIANAMNSNTEAKINLDLSDTDGLTEIPKKSFQFCNNLISINIPKSVTIISSQSFEDSGLTSVMLPNNLQNIGKYAFFKCSNLASIKIPDKVISIDCNAFSNCSSLTSVTFNNTSGWYYTNNSDFTGGEEIVVTDPVQNAENLKDTYSGYYWYRPTELTATADTVADTIRNLSAGTYMLKVSGEITSTTITTIATAMNSNTEAKINLDLSGANGLTEIPENAFYIDNTLNVNLISIIIPDNVTTIGTYAFFNCPSLTSVKIPDNVIEIKENAFIHCTALNSVTIGNGVTSIGDYAFSFCSGLTSIEIPDNVTTIGNYAFYECSNLTSIEIPNSVTTIGSNAFNYCENLTSVTFADTTSTWYYTESSDYTGGTVIDDVTDTAQNANNLKDTYSEYYWYRPTELTATADTVTVTDDNNNTETINFSELSTKLSTLSAGTYTLKVTGEITSTTITEIANAIRNLSSETYINLDLSGTTGLTEIPENAFYDKETYNGCTSLLSIIIPDSVTTIGTYAFSYCSGLTSIEIPNSVTTIGSYAFLFCSSLTSVTIGNGVTTIGMKAFYNCSNLISVTIPDSVTTIGDYAFYNCSSLEKITIPDSVTSIGYAAFSGCSNLTNFEVDTGNTNYSTSEDGTILFNGDKTKLIVYPSATGDFTIPNSVTSIADGAFRYCSNLTNVTIPDSVTTINCDVFFGCSNLTSIEIPNSVTTIGSNAFYYCENLTSVTFADTTSTWYYTESSDYTGGTVIDDVTNTAQNATKLKETYYDKYWYKSSTGGTTN